MVDVIVLAEDAFAGPVLIKDLDLFGTQPALLLVTNDPAAAYQLSGLPIRSWGALFLDSSAAELAAAVFALNEGLVTGSPRLLEAGLRTQRVASLDPDGRLLEPLTERELEVLQLLAQGLANKQIAASLVISEHTVKFHVSSIYAKMGASNRTEAVRLGVQQGLVVL
jgi:DNA-binding NarL/FixJ family response regulator